MNALQVCGLNVNYPSPDMDALRRFLGERFLHFADDLPADERPVFPGKRRDREGETHDSA